MKSVSTIALAAALWLGGANVSLASAAAAQTGQPVAPMQPQQRTFNLSAAERTGMAPLSAAVESNNAAAAQAALPAARAAAQSPEARYILGQMLLRWGITSQNVQLQSEAIDAMIASGAADASELPRLYDSQATLAMASGNRDRAEAALNRFIEASPNDPSALVRLAQFRYEQRRPQEAVVLVERAIAMAQASGRTAPESWYRYAVRVAFDNRMAQALPLSRGLLTAYPSSAHWRDALLAYRDVSQFDDDMRVDHFRMMRAAGALAGERDYSEMATLLNQRGLSAEAAAVLQEGVAARQVSATEASFRDLIATTGRGATQARTAIAARQRDARASTQGPAALAAADTLYGLARYPEAVELYRAAIQRGGADANVANLRLGAALAMAGQQAEAETAFRAVTGPRSELAQYWLAWLARRGA